MAGSRALIAASFAALTLLKDQVASAEGSFEDAYKALKDGLPHVSVDEDRFVRCMLEALHDLPADRLRELRERYRGAILIETAEREARLRARRNGAKQAGFLSLTGSLAAAVLLVAAAAISLAYSMRRIRWIWMALSQRADGMFANGQRGVAGKSRAHNPRRRNRTHDGHGECIRAGRRRRESELQSRAAPKTNVFAGRGSASGLPANNRD